MNCLTQITHVNRFEFLVMKCNVNRDVYKRQDQDALPIVQKDVGKPGSLVAENQREGALRPPSELLKGGLTLEHKGVEALLRELPAVVLKGVVIAEADVEECPHRGADHLGVVDVHSRPDDGEVVKAKAGACAQNGSQVAGIAGVDQHHMGLSWQNGGVGLVKDAQHKDIFLQSQPGEELLPHFPGNTGLAAQEADVLLRISGLVVRVDIHLARQLRGAAEHLHCQGHAGGIGVAGVMAVLFDFCIHLLDLFPSVLVS